MWHYTVVVVNSFNYGIRKMVRGVPFAGNVSVFSLIKRREEEIKTKTKKQKDHETIHINSPHSSSPKRKQKRE